VVRDVSPIAVGFIRAVVAGLCAVPALYLSKQRRPSRREWRGIAVGSLGIVYIYPVFVAWAMQRTPSSHGSIVVGLLPLATAAAAGILGYDRPPVRFWIAALLGSATVIVYALFHAGGALHPADVALLIAVVFSGIAYAEGGHIARTLGGWQVISWIMAVNLPIVIPVLAWLLWKQGFHASAGVIVALLFMGVFNQYVAFFGWYKAMARVGVARASQLQLLQPFMTVIVAALFLSEVVHWDTWLALAIVIATVFVARKAATRPISRLPSGGQ
jgi:drug/metabolite transporter (DMT)-like permease